MINPMKDALSMDIGLVLSNHGHGAYMPSGNLWYQIICAWRTGHDDQISFDDTDYKSTEFDEAFHSDYVDHYDHKIRDGDIITLQLDLRKKTMHLFVNERRFYNYFKIKMDSDIEYKIGMSVSQGTSITIVDVQTC